MMGDNPLECKLIKTHIVHSERRDELIKRFFAHRFDCFETYEALELLFSYAIQRNNTKDVARALIDNFGSLANVFDASEEQLNSYATQKKLYNEMIAENKNWCLAGIYADEGISGTLAKKRDEFKKMINDCLKGKIDYVITKSVSRFARNTAECLEYIRLLKNRGIGIFLEEQKIGQISRDFW